LALLLTPPSWFYGILYFLMVVLFTYFYTAVTFDPKQISENLQQSGAFIPGVRPGEHTRDHLATSSPASLWSAPSSSALCRHPAL
jgi:preprotein translocase subunit SecY